MKQVGHQCMTREEGRISLLSRHAVGVSARRKDQQGTRGESAGVWSKYLLKRAGTLGRLRIRRLNVVQLCPVVINHYPSTNIRRRILFTDRSSVTHRPSCSQQLPSYPSPNLCHLQGTHLFHSPLQRVSRWSRGAAPRCTPVES